MIQIFVTISLFLLSMNSQAATFRRAQVLTVDVCWGLSVAQHANAESHIFQGTPLDSYLQTYLPDCLASNPPQHTADVVLAPDGSATVDMGTAGTVSGTYSRQGRKLTIEFSFPTSTVTYEGKAPRSNKKCYSGVSSNMQGTQAFALGYWEGCRVRQ